MKDITNAQKQKAVIEFSALEKQLDTVLFARYDEDDDHPFIKAALGGATVAGAGAAGYGLYKKGLGVSTGEVPGGVGPVDTRIGSNLVKGAKAYGAQAKAYGSGLAADYAKAREKESIGAIFKRLFRRGVKAA